MNVPLRRKLTYLGANGEERTEDQDALVARAEPLVILGEAGMGKTTLLRALGEQIGRKPCTARQLINAPDPAAFLGDGDVLLIDALDEYAAAGEGDAVDRVLGRLGALGFPRFILSCRAADWRSATALRGIAEQYDAAPLELHLRPFDDEDARAFLAAMMPDRADEIVRHFRSRGLSDLLGNPQTLKMIADIANDGPLPDTIGEIFARSIDKMRHEHRDEKATTPLAQAPPEAVLDAVGAGFAALILTGSDALSRLAVAGVAPGDLHVSTVSALPDAACVGDFVGSRLWRPEGPDRFTFVHKRIGEYLGARWLAKHATTPGRRARLLARFRERGLVPASLRGLHAWLARSPALAIDIIEADPMGVVEYGDADTLTAEQGRALLRALEALSRDNPRFRGWGGYSLRGVVREELRDDVSRLLTAPDTAFALRTILLHAIKGSPIAVSLADDLRAMLLDPNAVFAERSGAGEALAALDTVADWPAIIEGLRCLADEDSVRLAVELLDDAGFERFGDGQIVETVFAQVGASLCEVPWINEHRSIAGLLRGVEKRLPDDRLDGVLGTIAQYAAVLHDRDNATRDHGSLTDLTFSLIARRIALGAVDPLRLWSWLEPFDGGLGYRREAGEVIGAYLRAEHDVRRAIQRHVLFDQPGDKTVWERAWRLERRSPALSVSLDPQDLITLLSILGTPDAPTEVQVEMWRDLVRMAGRGPEQGVEVRAAARPFLRARGDLLTWLDALDEPHKPDWLIKQEARHKDAERKRRARWAAHRREFSDKIDELRAGEWQHVLPPAQCYLRLFSDMGENLPAHERVAEWLGTELQDAAFQGFEAFLHADPPLSTATDIADSHADSKRWNAASIIVAALAERVRGRGLSDLSDERLQAGLLEIRQTHMEDHAKIDGITDAIEAELRRRGDAWVGYWRLQVEPQLVRRRTHIDGMYGLMRGEADAKLATSLAAEWLARFPDMPAEPEQEMIDRLLAAGRFDVLRDVGATRRAADFGDKDEPRRNWDAIELLTNFGAARARIGDAPERELLWHLRERLGERRRDQDGGSRVALGVDQMAWMVRVFRSPWPALGRPGSVTVGDTNPWDATEYLNGLIGRLGDDPSDAAMAGLRALRDAPADGYTETIRSVAAEQARKRAEVDYRPPSLSEIAAILTEGPPTDAADLQAVMVTALNVAQARLRGDPLDWYKGFYTEAGTHRDENDCRHELLKMLDGRVSGVEFRPESHLGDDKRVDIECSVGAGLMLPIEVKGQWHLKLWDAADVQLDHLYVNDRRAERGIYLILWFGADTTRMPTGQGAARPATPDDLRAMLSAQSRAVRDGRVAIYVLDLTRPPPPGA